MAIRIMVTGGSGYIGSNLTSTILKQSDNHVVNYDLGIFQNNSDKPAPIQRDGRLFNVDADIRDLDRFKAEVKGCKAVAHLACISNDPSFDLNPELGKSINWDCFPGLVKACMEQGVERFIYASSSSVYGVSDADKVDELHPCKPLTDYSKWKLECEKYLYSTIETYNTNDPRAPFHFIIVRPGTVCGWSPRQRFDLTVNRMVNEAYNKGIIKVDGGDQLRANLHIRDMVSAYCLLLQAPTDKVSCQVFNVSQCNMRVRDIAKLVADEVALRLMKKVDVDFQDTDDLRSYHICSDKFRKLVEPVTKPNWPVHNIRDAVNDLIAAFQLGKFDGVDTSKDDRFHGIRRIARMQKELMR